MDLLDFHDFPKFSGFSPVLGRNSAPSSQNVLDLPLTGAPAPGPFARKAREYKALMARHMLPNHAYSN